MVRFVLFVTILSSALGPQAAFTQAGGTFDLTWNTIDGGGGSSAGGSFTLSGTIGQPDAGVMSGGNFELLAGFWSGGELTPTSVESTADTVSIVPLVFAVHAAHPNPFNPVTNISYDLPERSHVRMMVYNLTGELVAVLINAVRPAGHHTVRWDATNQGGANAASGVYIVVTDAGKWTSQQKITLLK